MNRIEVSKMWLNTVLDSSKLLKDELMNHSENIEELFNTIDESVRQNRLLIDKMSDLEEDAFMMKERALSIHLSIKEMLEQATE